MLLVNEQRTPEWLEAHAGRVTASIAAACLGLDPHRGPLSAYNEIVNSRRKADNSFMRWGRDNEARARAAYECETGNFVTETGFWVDDAFDWLGASPDGFVGEDGMAEIKCPQALPTEIPLHHRVQMTVQLVVTGRVWCDYYAWTEKGSFLQRVFRHQKDEAIWFFGLKQFYEQHVLPKVPPPRRRKKAADVEAEPRPEGDSGQPDDPGGDCCKDDGGDSGQPDVE